MRESSVAAAGYRELAKVLKVTAAQARGLVGRHPHIGVKVGGVLVFTRRDAAALRAARNAERKLKRGRR